MTNNITARGSDLQLISRIYVGGLPFSCYAGHARLSNPLIVLNILGTKHADFEILQIKRRAE